MLTPLSKILIALVVVGVIGGGLFWLSRNPDVAQKAGIDVTATNAPSKPAPKRTASNDVIVVATNTWGGQAGIAYMNNGQKTASQDSRNSGNSFRLKLWISLTNHEQLLRLAQLIFSALLLSENFLLKPTY
jgi:hypothetical protein